MNAEALCVLTAEVQGQQRDRGLTLHKIGISTYKTIGGNCLPGMCGHVLTLVLRGLTLKEPNKNEGQKALFENSFLWA